jgi:hypothetical protein
LLTQKYECMVCFESIKLKDRIWSCSTCYALFHMKCINQWATVNQQSGSWNCPGCNTTKQQEIPKYYTCFCLKKREPLLVKGIPPHSCGQVCSKERSCPHPCGLKCHPGPCSDCEALGFPISCTCGKELLNLSCSTLKSIDFVPSCGKVCGKLLNCGLHACKKICGECIGKCGNCTLTESATCFCGNATKEIICGQPKLFSCGSPCNVKYSCGIHVCKSKCHQHEEMTVCQLDPTINNTCPCGKEISNRKSCTDPVPLCGQICLKPLICGHECQESCHFGDCPPCILTSTKTCRCGKSTLSVPCKDLDYDICEKVCKTKLPCKRHVCNVRCCPLDKKSHVCESACGKQLACKSHTCLMICSHEGDCHDCVEGVSFDELACNCGATIMYPPIPCGTLPPECNKPCRRTRECGHHQITRHYCHPNPDDCPPCMVFKTVQCACGSSELKNIPCSRTAIPSCGKPCTKIVEGCNHPCSRVCHEGPCVDSTHPCVRKCGKVRSCGHICQYKCHGVSECLEKEPCRQILKLVCNCGSKKKSVICGSSKDNPFKDPSTLLVCDSTCEKKLMMERMKHALDIDPSNTFLPFGGWQESMVKLAVSFPEVS